MTLRPSILIALSNTCLGAGGVAIIILGLAAIVGAKP